MTPIFSPNPDFNKSAFMNWHFDSSSDILHLLNLGEGYMDAAIALANYSLIDNQDKKADILIFPILMNVNHGIELYLKGLIWILNKLLDTEGRFEGKHNIKQIYDTARGKIKQYGKPSIKTFNSSTKGLKLYLDELYQKANAGSKNDKMDFSRYPVSNNYDDHFYVRTYANIEIDLENFVSRFTEIKTSLEAVTDYLYYQELNQEW